MPNTSDVYQDPLLRDISIRYSNPDFIADKVFPVLNVDKRTGYYFVYDKSNLRTESSVRTGVTRANRVDYNLSKTAYGPLIEHSLEIPIEYDVLNQYDAPLEPRTDATLTVTEKLAIEKEIALAATLADTAIITQNTTLSGTSQWSDYGNSNPFSDIQAGIDSMAQNGIVAPNTLVMGWAVWSKIINHPDFLERVKYSALGTMSEATMKQLFPNIQNIYVSKAVKNGAVQGQADSLSFVWGKHVQLMYVTPTPALRSITAGYTLTLNGGRMVENWNEQPVKAEFVRVTDYYEQKTVAAEAAYLIKNAVA
jgi:hypothetical protein